MGKQLNTARLDGNSHEDKSGWITIMTAICIYFSAGKSRLHYCVIAAQMAFFAHTQIWAFYGCMVFDGMMAILHHGMVSKWLHVIDARKDWI